jgi:hypothetical protein
MVFSMCITVSLPFPCNSTGKPINFSGLVIMSSVGKSMIIKELMAKKAAWMFIVGFME